MISYFGLLSAFGSKLDETAVRPGSYVYERTKAAIDHCYEHIQDLEQLGFSNEGQIEL